MLLLWMLIIGNIIGGFIAASAIIVGKLPELGKVAGTLEKSKTPIGAVVLGISVLNIFNFWGPHYPKLTLLGGLLTGMVLSIGLLNYIEMSEEAKGNITSIANKIQVPAGIFSIVIGLIWILKLFFDILESLL
ncbi:MAG: hypothetical protein JW827_05005 [Spirochaetes bacterium]|nr:hypothetical protein [Spirochaetota bacterium]